MAKSLPPLPQELRALGRAVTIWLNDISTRITSDGQIGWSQIDKTVSDLADLATRAHASLQSILAVDPADTNAIRDKHVSNADMKAAADHHAATSAHGVSGNLVGVGNTATSTTAGVVKAATLVADLGQTISNPPTQADVQAISNKVDELLATLRTAGILEI